VVTFKNSDALRDIARNVPLDRLLVETDAPYLAPEPLRGRTNEPANVVHTAKRLAEVRGLSEAEIAKATTDNFFRLFKKVEGAALRGIHILFMTLKLTILGCGTSGGVPRVGNIWGACDPANPKNRRRRCSVLVQREGTEGTTNVLVDTPPDLREQLLDVGVGWLDGVLFTHDHADHTHGIDDLRMVSYNGRRRVAVYYDEVTGQQLRQRFAYCFNMSANGEYPPILQGHELAPGAPVTILGEGGPIEALPFRQRHGSGETLGFRFGDIAYSPDVSDLPEDSLQYLEDLDVWILDALRYTRHPSHFSVEEALHWIERIKPKRAVLTHMHVDLDYEALARELPDEVEPAYDGMVLMTKDNIAVS
jgi:phosphoribosyl 1,2-cyclic phosphate phosphodiesterase